MRPSSPIFSPSSSTSGRRAALVAATVAATALVAVPAAPVGAAAAPAADPAYRLAVLVDSTRDGLDPYAFGCAAVNVRGEVAFRGRPRDPVFSGPDTVYRVQAGSPPQVLVRDDDRYAFIHSDVALNDRGQVSFGAVLKGRGEQAVFRVGPAGLTRIASTTGRFDYLGLETSLDVNGRVTFVGAVQDDPSGRLRLASGDGVTPRTHAVLASTRIASRPSTNNAGAVAWADGEGEDRSLLVRSPGRTPTSVYASVPDVDDRVSVPVLSDRGDVAFTLTVNKPGDRHSEVRIVRGDRVTTVATTEGTAYQSFGTHGPALNAGGEVAFQANLGRPAFTAGIFTGPRPSRDAVITSGTVVGGLRVTNVQVCEQGLNDAGQVAVVAQLDDPASSERFRSVVLLATPR